MPAAASNHILLIDSSGSSFDIGAVTGLPASFVCTVGEIDDQGNYYVMQNSGNTMYKINIPAMTATTITLSPSIFVSDLAFNFATGLLYGTINGSGELASINPVSGATTVIGTATAGGTFGAMFGASNGVFGISNSGGFYQFNITTGTRVELASAAFLNANVDGAHCVTSLLNTSPLPIFLANFEAKKHTNNVELIWATVGEKNNKAFDIERSFDGSNWNTLGTVNSMGKDGNSTIKLEYSFRDENPIMSKNFYRLKQIDFDGKFDYSSVAMVTFNKEHYISVYPNPVSNELSIDGLDPGSIVSLLNIMGQKLNLRNVISNENRLSINTSNLAHGVYYLVVTSNDGRTIISQKVVKE